MSLPGLLALFRILFLVLFPNNSVFRKLVEKTAGEQEHTAFRLLQTFVSQKIDP